jgi:hypothetical protein
MYARAVDDASARLQALRQEEWQDLGLAALALGLALIAAQTRTELAIPLLLGGILVGARGVRALWRRWDLLDRLAGDRDAYTIAEVRAIASREATMEKRHYFAAVIRGALAHPHPGVQARTSSLAEELSALVCELDDSSLGLDPASAVACARLVSDPAQSLLFNPELPPEELRSRVHQIRSRFTALNREG